MAAPRSFPPIPSQEKKKNESLRTPAWAIRLAGFILPKSWFSDPITGKPGRLRRLLIAIGPSALSSPVRRIVQAICFVLFLWLFFHVCWPYDAQPDSTSGISTGWRLDRFVGETGNLQLTNDQQPKWRIEPGLVLHVVDDRAPDAIRGRVGEFAVVEYSRDRVVLSPKHPLSAEQLDGFLMSSGTWSLHERSPWPSHYTDRLSEKEFVPAEVFLVIDPLVSLSTAIASRSWVWSLVSAAVILIVCVLIPRGFCGYLCPLGTLIDLFDWGIGQAHRTISRGRRRLVGSHQILPAAWHAHLFSVRRVGFRVRRGDPGDHTGHVVPGRAAANGHAARSGATSARPTPDISCP